MLENLLSDPIKSLDPAVLADIIASAKNAARIIANLPEDKFNELDELHIFDMALVSLIDNAAYVAGYVTGLSEERVILLQSNLKRAYEFLTSIKIINTYKVGEIGDLYEF